MKSYVRAKRLSVCGAPVLLHWSVLVVIGGCLATAISDPVVAVVAAGSYFGVILIDIAKATGAVLPSHLSELEGRFFDA